MKFLYILMDRTSITEIKKGLNAKGTALFLNPLNNILHVNLPYPNQNYSIEIYSLLGQLLLKTSEKTVIELSDFRNGIYIIALKQDNKIWTSKIVKQ
jgi:hypothetical protein